MKNPKTSKTDNKTYRPPIITIMGHVDHGKTSLLDALRQSNITSTESGGITQHTGAYIVEKDGKKLIFIDTPGHEAFTQMRARGGKAADIVILVVAADDGVMPQTKEAIMHAKAANVDIVVALNKCDLVGANPDKVKKQLAQEGIAIEGYGGNIVCTEVSAIKKTGLDELLEVLFLIGELNKTNFEVDPQGQLKALIIESKHDAKKGALVTAVVKNGTLKLRDHISAGMKEGKVKQLLNNERKPVKEAVPGDIVEILGFTEAPLAGEMITEAGEEVAPNSGSNAHKIEAQALSEEKAEERKKEGKNLNVIIRADTVGTLEAITASLKKLNIDEASCNILFEGIGDVKESDVLLASTSKAVIVAFKVKVPRSVADIAENQKIIIREHDIIYKLIEEIEGALEGVLEIEEAKIRGKGFVIKIFELPKSKMKVIGTFVEVGRFKANDRVGIFREDKDNPLYISRIKSIHVGNNEVKEATKGQECGLLFKPQVEDIQLDDIISVY